MSTTPKHNKTELYDWSKDEIVQRVVELEDELLEFQGYSKELEEALEEELKQLEDDNKRLKQSNQGYEQQIKQQLAQIKQLKTEVRSLEERFTEERIKYDTDTQNLKQKLVDVEIINDSMESNDRLISNKLDLMNQFNSELLEKIALLENDLHLEKKANHEKELFISNYENTISDLKKQLADDTAPGDTTVADVTNGEVDVLVLSMKDVLRAGPPVSPFSKTINNGMKKSDSLQKLHDLTIKTEGLSYKVKSLRRESLYLTTPNIKSPSTTQLSNHLHTSNSGNDKVMEKSKTSKNLTSMLIKESQKTDQDSSIPKSSRKSVLEPISGSPNVNHVNHHRKKFDHKEHREKKKKRGMFSNIRSLALGH